MIFKAQACKNYLLIKEETVSLTFGKGFFLTVKLVEFLAAIYNYIGKIPTTGKLGGSISRILANTSVQTKKTDVLN